MRHYNIKDNYLPSNWVQTSDYNQIEIITWNNMIINIW